MENFDVKNFCLIVLGSRKNVMKELQLISEDTIKFLEGDQIFIATFKSILFAKDIEIILSDLNVNFIITEMVPSLFSMDLGTYNEKLILNHTPKTENIIYEQFQEVSKKIEKDLSLDELLDLITEKGYNYLTEKQKAKLKNYSGDA